MNNCYKTCFSLSSYNSSPKNNKATAIIGRIYERRSSSFSRTIKSRARKARAQVVLPTIQCILYLLACWLIIIRNECAQACALATQTQCARTCAVLRLCSVVYDGVFPFHVLFSFLLFFFLCVSTPVSSSFFFVGYTQLCIM